MWQGKCLEWQANVSDEMDQLALFRCGEHKQAILPSLAQHRHQFCLGARPQVMLLHDSRCPIEQIINLKVCSVDT